MTKQRVTFSFICLYIQVTLLQVLMGRTVMGSMLDPLKILEKEVSLQVFLTAKASDGC